jgi:hypothetical protein
MTARLSEFYADRPIAGRRVDLYMLHPSYAAYLGRGYTNNNGVAAVTVSLVRTSVAGVGVYPVGWHFAGDGYYSSPLPTATLTVTR